jgi:hypothetical protein
MWRYFWRTAGDRDPSRTDHVSAEAWKVFPQGESEGRCDCCRSVSMLVWGQACRAGGWDVAYSVHWTPGASKKQHPANFDFVVRAGEENAIHVSMILYDRDGGGVGVMVIDAAGRAFASAAAPGAALARDEVVGTPLAAPLFALFDAVALVSAGRLVFFGF